MNSCFRHWIVSAVIWGAMVLYLNLERAEAAPGDQILRLNTSHPIGWHLPEGASTIDFGMTPQQRQKIFELTNGEIDLRHWYRVPSSSQVTMAAMDAMISESSGSIELMGSIGPVVPPPGIVSEDYRDNETERRDPDLLEEWWIDALDVEPVWQTVTGQGVIIADCDTGFYIRESDLEANLLIDDRRDFSDYDAPYCVTDGKFIFHGTAVAAIMTGVRDGVGTHGIAFGAKLVPLQNYNYDEKLDDINKEEATAQCILHALKNPDVDIIVVQNQTIDGSSETYAGTREAVSLALRSGVVVVSAAGNASKELIIEKRHDTGSIIVGALRRNGHKANFSNFGDRVTISAFGEGIRTLYGPNGRIDSFAGTTASTAQVAAAIALMKEANPDLTPAQIRNILIRTRRYQGDNWKVGGRLNIRDAVYLARNTEADNIAAFQQALLRQQYIDALRD